MQKTESQKANVQSQPAAKKAGIAAVEPAQSEATAQLEAMIESSPQTAKQGNLVAMMNGASVHNGNPAMAAQRRMMAMVANGLQPALQRMAEMIHNSPRQQAAQKFSDGINNSPMMVAQRKKMERLFGAAQRVGEEGVLQGKFAGEAPTQLEQQAKPNNTGLPDNLKSGIENLSGMSMDNVKVHYNSSQPAQLNALAYAQGTDIHVAPGQEQHLPHEAWHVVQQAQGRVKPTMQMKDGVPVNDDAGLEREADVMGGKAVQLVHVQNVRPAPGVSIHYNSDKPASAQGRVQPTTQKIGMPVNHGAGIIQRVTTVNVTNTTDNYDSGWVQTETQSTGVDSGPRAEAQAVAGIAGGSWVGGHMVNDRLGGDGGFGNIVPITSSMNNQHHTIENAAQNIVGNGGTPYEVRYRMNILRRTNYTITPNNDVVNNLPDQFRQHYDYRTKEVQAGGTLSRPIPYQAAGPIITVDGQVLDMNV